MLRTKGFTLIQLIIAILILSMLTLAAYPAYLNHVRAAKLAQAHQMLLQDAHFMNRFYQQKGSFKSDSTHWPQLPKSGNTDFCIGLHNQAKGALEGEFILKAVAYDKTREPRVLKIDESMVTSICESSQSSCDALKDHAFNGKDDKCSLYHP